MILCLCMCMCAVMLPFYWFPHKIPQFIYKNNALANNSLCFVPFFYVALELWPTWERFDYHKYPGIYLILGIEPRVWFPLCLLMTWIVRRFLCRCLAIEFIFNGNLIRLSTAKFPRIFSFRRTIQFWSHRKRFSYNKSHFLFRSLSICRRRCGLHHQFASNRIIKKSLGKM